MQRVLWTLHNRIYRTPVLIDRTVHVIFDNLLDQREDKLVVNLSEDASLVGIVVEPGILDPALMRHRVDLVQKQVSSLVQRLQSVRIVHVFVSLVHGQDRQVGEMRQICACARRVRVLAQ